MAQEKKFRSWSENAEMFLEISKFYSFFSLQTKYQQLRWQHIYSSQRESPMMEENKD